MSTWTSPARQATQAAGSGSNPYTFTYGSAVLASSLLIATITWTSGSGTISSFTDNVNNAQWTLAKLVQGQARTVATYFFNNSAAGTPTISITLNAPQTQFMAALEFVGPRAILGANGSNSAVATTSPTSNSITPQSAISLICGVMRGGSVSAGEGGSWVLVATGSGVGFEYIQPGTTSALAATFTTSSSAYAAEIFELIPVSDGGTSDSIENSSASITTQIATDGATSDAIENSTASITAQVAIDGGTSDAIENSSASITGQIAVDGATSDAIENSFATLVTPQVGTDGGVTDAIENSSATLTTPDLVVDGGTSDAIENSSAICSLVVPAFQLYPSFPTAAPALSQLGIRNYSKGLFQLITGNQSSNFPAQPALTDPWYSGYSFREHWNVVEATPVDVTQPNWQSLLNWTNLDAAVSAVKAVGKYCGLSIFAGKNSPTWLAGPPFNCYQFLVNSISTYTVWDPSVTYNAGQVVLYTVDGRYYNALNNNVGVTPGTDETIWDQISTPFDVSAPWDPTFIQRWTYIIEAFGARYDPDPTVAYIVISGGGTGDAEGFVAKNLNDVAELNGPPTNGIGPWITAVEGFFQSFIDAFPNTPVVYVTGNPIPYNDNPGFVGTQPTSLYLGVPRTGLEIQQIITTYAVGNWGRKWGLRSSGLRQSYNLHSFGATAITQYGRNGSQLPSGFQMLKQSFDEPSTDAAMNVGYGLGGFAFEIYSSEMYEPMSQNWAQLILAAIYSSGDLTFTPQVRELSGTINGIGQITAASFSPGQVQPPGGLRGEFSGHGEIAITGSGLRHLRIWVVLGVTCIIDPEYDPTVYYNSGKWPPPETGPQPVPPGCGFGLPIVLFPMPKGTWPLQLTDKADE